MEINWGLFTAMISFSSIALLIFGMEKKGELSARQIPVIAVLVAFCAAGKAVTGVGLLFLQPTMFLVELTGFVYGIRIGFFVGAMTPLIANFFVGQGPWTPFQMICWGMVGVSGAFIKAAFPGAGNKILTALCFFWGYFYGALMNVYQWSFFMSSLTLKTYILVLAAGFSFDSLRAVSNLLFCLVLGGQTLKILQYFRKKMNYQYVEDLQE